MYRNTLKYGGAYNRNGYAARYSIPSAAESSLLGDLTHYWTLNETSGNRADSVGSGTLSASGSVTYDSGKKGNALKLTGGFLTRASDSSYSLSGGKTFSFWLNMPADVVGNECYIGKWDDDTYEESEYNLGIVGLSAPHCQLAFTVDGGTGNSTKYWTATTALNIDLAAWHLVIGGWDNVSGDAFLYVDGTAATLAHTGGPTTPHAGTMAFTLGSRSQFAGQGKGLIDEAAFWGRVLTSDERAELYNAGAGKFYPF